jgi:hypothetical protein
MSFQCNEQAVHIVHCNGSTWCRQLMPTTRNTVLLSIGTSLESHIQLTTWCSRAYVKCPLVVEDAISTVTRHLALVQMIPTEHIRETAGMVIVAERHQLLMSPFMMEDTIRILFRALEPLLLSLYAWFNELYTIFIGCLSEIECSGSRVTQLPWMLSPCLTYILFHILLEVIIAAIWRNLVSVYSGCLKFVMGVVQACIWLMSQGIK